VRIGKATGAFNQLNNVWKNKNISISNKVKIYLDRLIMIFTGLNERHSLKTINKIDEIRLYRKIRTLKLSPHTFNLAYLTPGIFNFPEAASKNAERQNFRQV
jgi:hypothetical protein